MKKTKPKFKEEKIRQGFNRKGKLLIPAGLIGLFILMSFIAKFQQVKNSRKSEITIPQAVQRAIYSSYKLAQKEILKEGNKKYPLKEIKKEQKLQFNTFYKKYTDKANSKIKQHYKINTNTLAKIIMKGDNKSRGIVRLQI